MDARRGARHVPAPAPPGDAVRHRGALGRAAAPRDRPGAADRRPLAGRRRARRRRPRPRSARWSSSSPRSATPVPTAGSCRPAAGSRRCVYVPVAIGPTFEALRPGDRAPGARPAAAPRADAARRSTAASVAGRPGVVVAGGEIEAAVRVGCLDTACRRISTASGSRRSWPRPRAGSSPPAPASRTTRSRRRRRRRRRGRLRPRGRAGGPGGAAPGSARPLGGVAPRGQGTAATAAVAGRRPTGGR